MGNVLFRWLRAVFWGGEASTKRLQKERATLNPETLILSCSKCKAAVSPQKSKTGLVRNTLVAVPCFKEGLGYSREGVGP